MSRAETVLFDLDGTLTDSKPGIQRSARYAIDRLNETGPAVAPPSQADLDAIIGPPLRDGFLRFVDKNRIEQMLAFYRERYDTIGAYENAVYPGIPEQLAALRAAGYRLLVATSKFEGAARDILAHFDLAKYFDAIFGATADGARAHKPDLLAYALQDQQVDSRRAVMIGDRKFDVAGALEVGIVPIGVLWGYGSREELSTAGARALIETPAEITAAVEAELG
jgi:phosphoglycolate phosphatase